VIASQERFKAVISVHIILMRDNKILLGQRQNTGYSDGLYHLPAGHLDPDETFVDATLRETKEELGIDLSPQDIDLVYVIHHHERVGLFFMTENPQQEPQNMEPDKCSRLDWFELNKLPENMVAYAKHAITEWAQGKKFGVFGWDEETLCQR
jgi:8-oxo-dGTP diphosphatase